MFTITFSYRKSFMLSKISFIFSAKTVAFSRNSTRGCISLDGKLYHTDFMTDPFTRRKCLNDGKPYQLDGVFGNMSLGVRKTSYYEFKVSLVVRNIQYFETIMAEFGIVENSANKLHRFGWSIKI